jgi:hypothetical protein
MASATAHLATVAAKGTMALPRPSSSGTARPATLVLHVTGKEIVYFPAFPLRSSAAVRLSSLLRAKSGAQDGEGAHGEPDEVSVARSWPLSSSSIFSSLSSSGSFLASFSSGGSFFSRTGRCCCMPLGPGLLNIFLEAKAVTQRNTFPWHSIVSFF